MARGVKAINFPWNDVVLVVAYSTLSCVLGFAYGSIWSGTSALKDWLPLGGSALTATSIIVAWLMARRTFRFNAISREETRLEEKLPGLREATAWLSLIFDTVDNLATPEETFAVLNSRLRVSKDKSIKELVDKALQLAEGTTREQVTYAVANLYFAARGLDNFLDMLGLMHMGREHNLRTNPEAIRQRLEHVDAISKAAYELMQLRDNFRARLKTLETRLTRLRGEIDRYLELE